MRRLLGFAGIALAGCDGGRDPARSASSVVDDAGRVVALEPPARRIASLLPSATGILIELGASERVVARTAWDAQPEVAHTRSLGRTLSPSVEAVYALRPDLVIVPRAEMSGASPDALARLGLRVYVADAQTLDDVRRTIERLGALLALRPRADTLLRGLDAELSALRARRRGAETPTVLFVVWHAPPTAAGAGTYVDDLIRAAGGANILADVRGWPRLSLEELVRRDPDVIVVPRGEHSVQPDWLTEAAGWRDLHAVRARRLVVVDADLFNRPGVRFVEAARTLRAALFEAVAEGGR